MQFAPSHHQFKIGSKINALASLKVLFLLGLTLPAYAGGHQYVIAAPGDCNAFLSTVGAIGQELTDASGFGGVCVVSSGTLLAEDSISFGNGWNLWVHGNGDGSTNFTNRGTVNLNSEQLSDATANLTPGWFDNQGILNINGGGADFSALHNSGTVNVTQASSVNSLGEIDNIGIIYNAGQVKTTSPIRNSGIIANVCGGTLIAAIGVSQNPPVNSCEQ